MQPDQQTPQQPNTPPPAEPETPQQPATGATPTPAEQAPVAQTAPQQPTEDPGKVFSIIGIVCAFIFLQLPGLILSIIGLRKSKKAGFSTKLGVIGIILNIVTTLVSIGVLAAITMVAYNGVQQRAEQASQQTIASSIASKAEVMQFESGMYPKFADLHAAEGEFALTDEEKAALKETDQPQSGEVGYISCIGSDGKISGANMYVFSEENNQSIKHDTLGECESATDSSY